MVTPPDPRKQVRHYDLPGHVHELTFSCYERRPLLTNDTWRAMLSVAIDRACDRHGYRLSCFVYMPEHIHLLVLPDRSASSVAELLKAIKRPFSFRIKKLLEESGNRLLQELTIRQRPGVQTFRFWQEGPGYDRNLTEPSTTQKAIEYIHLNPVRRRLCEQVTDWKWSSARFYYEECPAIDKDLPTVTSFGPDVLGDDVSIM